MEERCFLFISSLGHRTRFFSGIISNLSNNAMKQTSVLHPANWEIKAPRNPELPTPHSHEVGKLGVLNSGLPDTTAKFLASSALNRTFGGFPVSFGEHGSLRGVGEAWVPHHSLPRIEPVRSHSLGWRGGGAGEERVSEEEESG